MHSNSDIWGSVVQRDVLLRRSLGRLKTWKLPDALAKLDDAWSDILVYFEAELPSWLYHPVVLQLGYGDARPLPRAVAALAWIGGHLEGAVPDLDLPHRLQIWTPGGGEELERGSFSVSQLAAHMWQGDATISLDVWALLTGKPEPGSWASLPRLSGTDQSRLKREIMGYLAALEFLRNELPEIHAWVRHATCAVIPLVQRDDGRIRSMSRPAEIGIVYSDAPRPLDLIEALVHESAHQHFFLAETVAPLVEADHDAMYFSPLRRGPRPLRGVYLAYHALAHILEYYRQALPLVPEEARTGQLPIVRDIERSLRITEDSLAEGREYLTRHGRTLFDALQARSKVLLECSE